MAGGQEQGEKAKGFSVRVTVECINPDGEIMSDIPSGGWYGFENEYNMNKAANRITTVVTQETDSWNEFKYGPNTQPPGQVKR